MRVLVACEFSGTVRDAFARAGHDAVSCDLLPTESPGQHYQGDVFDIIGEGWDLMIAHPPCTYLTVTGNKWFKPEFAERFPDRAKNQAEAVEFFLGLARAPIPHICIENPVGVMSTLWRSPDQIIQPYYFGDPHSKATCLWLKSLPHLVPTNICEPEFVTFRSGNRMAKWYVEAASLPPAERAKERSKTFPGIAEAMATQWGGESCLSLF